MSKELFFNQTSNIVDRMEGHAIRATAGYFDYVGMCGGLVIEGGLILAAWGPLQTQMNGISAFRRLFS